MNRELYQSLVSATKYCQVCEQVCEYLQIKQEAIKAFEQHHAEIQWKKLRSIWKMLLFSGLIFISSVIFLIVGMSMIANGETFNEISVVIAIVIITLLLFIVAIIRLIKNNKDSHHTYENEIKPKITEGQIEIKEIKEGAEKYEETYGYLLDFLPVKYRNLEATSFMLMAVTDQRAETLKEAMNLYEEQLHRWKVEDAVQKNIEMQQYMADAIDELNSRQAETNAHLSAIEQYEFIEYLKK